MPDDLPHHHHIHNRLLMILALIYSRVKLLSITKMSQKDECQSVRQGFPSLFIQTIIEKQTNKLIIQ